MYRPKSPSSSAHYSVLATPPPTPPTTIPWKTISSVVQAELSQGPKVRQNHRIHNDITFRCMGNVEWAQAVARIISNLDKASTQKEQLEDMVDRIPRDLSAALDEIVEGLEDVPNALSLLQWMVCVDRRLTLDELRWAMVLGSASFSHEGINACKSDKEFAFDDLAFELRIIELSGGLVGVNWSSSEGGPVAQLVHSAAKEYLRQKGLLKLDSEAASSDAALGRAHARVARDCIRSFAVMSSTNDIAEVPLYAYAAHNWVLHAQDAERKGQWVESLAEEFGLPSTRVRDIWAQAIPEYGQDKIEFIHLLLELGLGRSLSAALPEMVAAKIDLNSRDEFLQTPLSIAARTRQEEVVRRLRLWGADPNVCDVVGVSALGHAVKNGGMGVVQTMLSPETSPVAFGEVDMARKGKRQQKLNERILPIDANLASGGGRSPLAIAAAAGNAPIVQLLVDVADVDVNATDIEGETPLSLAIARNHFNIVCILLGVPGIDVNTKDRSGNTLLMRAIAAQNKRLISILLDYDDIDVNARDEHGRTAIYHAITQGESIFRLLLQDPRVEVNIQDTSTGDSPLMHAVKNDRRGALTLLLERSYVDRSLTDKWDRTALSIAAHYGFRRVTDLLLAAGGFDIEHKDSCGGTPLCCAAGRGRTGVVKALLEDGEVDLNATNDQGMTPLMIALMNGKVETAKVLFWSGQADLAARDIFMHTPLLWAVKCPDAADLVREMLADVACDASAKNSMGQNALWLCVRRPKTAATLKLLLKSGKFDINTSVDMHGRTVLSSVAEMGSDIYLSIILNWIETHGEDGYKFVHQPDFLGKVPLHYAGERDNDSAMIALLKYPGIQLETRDVVGRTPLFTALMRGSLRTAELLLWTGKVYSLPCDGNGFLPWDLIENEITRIKVLELLRFWIRKRDGKDFYGEEWAPLARQHRGLVAEVREYGLLVGRDIDEVEDDAEEDQILWEDAPEEKIDIFGNDPKFSRFNGPGHYILVPRSLESPWGLVWSSMLMESTSTIRMRALAKTAATVK